MSMLKRFAVATLATLFLAGPALAEPAIFTWTGYGLNVPGSGKCPTYKMTIDVTVVGTDVQGPFPAGRPPGAELQGDVGRRHEVQDDSHRRRRQ
jgi:hypothetical protein